jgi:hypothetical protein
MTLPPMDNYSIAGEVRSKIETIMFNNLIDEGIINRKYLPEIFNRKTIEISKKDGLPMFKPFILEYLKQMGIISTFHSNIIKFALKIKE